MALGKNIGISQPIKEEARSNNAKSVAATYEYPNSIKNSYFNTLNFGTPNGSNRKLKTYNQTQTVNTNRVNMEKNVGQMDRLNRIKATAINKSK
jgi:hypothetical protein